MKTILLAMTVTVTASLLLVACGSDGQDSACAELEQKCPHCTIPGLQATCEAAVESNDHGSCVDGLEDPDVINNCVAPSGNVDASGGNDIDAGNTGNAVCGNPNECFCPVGVTCDYQCLSGLACDMECLTGSSCTTACTGNDFCAVECVTASNCNVDCNAGGCNVSCPVNNCTVTNCPAGSCDVTCGLNGTPTRDGTTATCP